jgi:DNA-binding LytR/AlgR family response regulator
MKINCIAIDDEPPALKIIQEYCSRIPYLNLISCTTDPFEAIQKIKYDKPDLLFLDITMPGITGMDIAKSIQYTPLVIFSTAYSRYAVEGFDLDAVDFLLKPYSFERFEKAVLKARKKIEQNQVIKTLTDDDYLIVKIDYQNVKILFADILYIEALDNYSKIYTKDKSYMTLMNLKAISLKMPEDKFVRVHKSFIVALSQIAHFTHESIMVGKYLVPIGRTYLQGFLIVAKK